MDLNTGDWTRQQLVVYSVDISPTNLLTTSSVMTW